MKKNKRIVIVSVVVLVLLGIPVAWWLASPLFIQDAVDEAFPFAVPSSEEIKAMSPAEAEAAVIEIMAELEKNEIPEEEMDTIQERVNEIAAMMPEHEMDEGMPEAAEGWLVVGGGNFQDADSFHKGSGTATILQQGEARVLRFEDFMVTNGPDLHVLLVENVEGGSEMGNYLDLGPLKGNIGNQNYEIPAGVNLEDYSGIMIYCVPFHVVFATAPLE